MIYPVKNFNYAQRGAPVLNGTPNAEIALLKACLIDGFGEVTAITGSITNGVCTLMLNSGESFDIDKVISVSGVNVQSINGEQWVTSNTNNSVSFKTLESDQTLTGTIKVKYAPVGNWYMPFSGTSLAVFKSTHPLASDIYFRIDDTQATYSTYRMYQRMADVNNGEKYYPIPSQLSCYYPKSNSANTNATGWNIVADGKTVYMSRAVAYPTNSIYFTNQAWITTGFGDFLPWGYSNKLNAFLLSMRTTAPLSNAADNIAYGNDLWWCYGVGTGACIVFQNAAVRSYGVSVIKAPKLNQINISPVSGLSSEPINLPNKKIITTDIILVGNNHYIGTLPGVQFIANNVTYDPSNNFTTTPGVDRFIGRKMMKIPGSYSYAGSNTSSSNRSTGLIDISGDWG